MILNYWQTPDVDLISENTYIYITKYSKIYAYITNID